MGLLDFGQRRMNMVMEKIIDNPWNYFSLSNHYRKNPQVIRAVLLRCPDTYTRFGEYEKSFVTKDMVICAIRKNDHISDILAVFRDFNQDEDVCVTAVNVSSKNMCYIDHTPDICRSIIMKIIDMVRLRVNRDVDDYFNHIKNDQSQYVYYIPKYLLDKDMKSAIRSAIDRSIKTDEILIEVGYGDEFTY